ncbi:Zn-dependent carboxypeptidase [Candidatus Phytoplasma mali]|uniref:Metal-dependent carboxypeptidase n=1 Tax=Phytoplasma mali (strain AT) TaxID=482235 RepID=B3R039_PHYMT|nr:carboxypeptidase M32 [Candidatus Phytoplasma mali]CAP18203.1 Zn-dependent carboxypeptidase [Candidatus Phytoplasma mali]CAP18669.1 Zn-dependent carboxypeptidase [Candidatus Phytoplasma mali]
MNFYYHKLEQRFEEIGHLGNILNLLSWDIACNMKNGSENSRTKEIITLNNIIRKLLISKENKNWLLEAQKEIKDLDQWQQVNLKEIALTIKNKEIISEELQNKLILATNQADLIWRKAKVNNDYELFKPYLSEVIKYTKEIAQVRAKALGLSLYDALIDLYDTGTTVQSIKKTFAVLKEKLPPLIKEILKKQQLKKHLYQQISLPIKQQKKINYQIMQTLGFDTNKGRLDESAHPFCGGTPHDVRLTTHYSADNFLNSFYATVHETGHALYEQNLPEKYKNQPVGNARGFQFHESQSLLMEKQVGKSKEFLNYLTNLLSQKFNLNDDLFKTENLYLAANQVKPDFIRIYSDEVTYCLHIILRFEIEELLINDRLSLDELPTVWNQKMQDYLGISPKNFTEGCLQDVHWSAGCFGYFPSYANGMIIAAMVMEKIKTIYPNIKNDFIQGEFSNLNQYLNQNFRNFGSLYSSEEMLFQLTGEKEVNPYTFLKYLEDKYLFN